MRGRPANKSSYVTNQTIRINQVLGKLFKFKLDEETKYCKCRGAGVIRGVGRPVIPWSVLFVGTPSLEWLEFHGQLCVESVVISFA